MTVRRRSKPGLLQFVEKRRAVRVFLLQEVDELLEPLFGDELLHLFEVVSDRSVVTPSRLASGKRDEQFAVALEVFDRIDGCDRIPIPAQ